MPTSPRARDARGPYFSIERSRHLTSLALVTVGVFFTIALLHYHYWLGGSQEPAGYFQALVIRLYDAVGFVSSLFLSLFVTLWSAVAFLRGRLRGPLRRMGAAVLFAVCLAVLSASLVGAGAGGSLGTRVATQMTSIFGGVFVSTLLFLMTAVALLLASDWLFYRFFLVVFDRSSVGTPSQDLRTASQPVLASASIEKGAAVLTAAPAASRPDDGVAPTAIVPRPEPVELSKPKTEESDLIDQVLLDARRKLAERDSHSGSTETPERPAGSAQVAEGGGGVPQEVQTGEAVPTEQAGEAENARRAPSAALVGREDPAEAGHQDEDSAKREVSEAAASGDSDAELTQTSLVASLRPGDPVPQPIVKPKKRVRVERPELSRSDAFLAAQPMDEISPVQKQSLESVFESAREAGDGAEGDLFDDLDDPALLAQAGQTLDRMWTDGDGVELADGASLTRSGAAENEQDAEGEDAGSSSGAAGSREGAASSGSGSSGSAERRGSEKTKGGAERTGAEQGRAADRSLPAEAEGVAETEGVDGEAAKPDAILTPMPRVEPKVEIFEAPAQGHPPQQEELFGESSPSDELLDRAAQILLTARRPMPSLLQRRLGLPFAEALGIMDQLESLGALRAPRGTGPWEIRMDLAEWQARDRHGKAL